MRRPTLVLALAASLALGACGDDDEEDTATTPPAQTTQSAPEEEAPEGELPVEATDFAFDPSEVGLTSGELTISMVNNGSSPHELVVVRTDRPADGFPVRGGRAVVEGELGEIPETAPGGSGSHTFQLEPGRYVFLCNVPGHYQAGMHGTMTVE